jgi:hypothetical protein
MRAHPLLLLAPVAALIVAAASLGSAPRSKVHTPAAAPVAARTVARKPDFRRLPLSFEENRCQTDACVKFLSRGPGYTLFLTPTEAVLSLSKKSGEGHGNRWSELNHRITESSNHPPTLTMRLAGANPAARVSGAEKLPGVSNYLVGNDPKRWQRGVPTYRKVRYEQVYPGIDLVYYGRSQAGSERELEYDFIVAPGADPDRIALTFAGADRVRLDGRGDLVLQTGDATVRWRKPVCYQEIAGRRVPVEGAYVRRPDRSVAFDVGGYDRTLPLTIDPSLNYSTFLGGSYDDYGASITVDADGFIYVSGSTNSPNFPLRSPLPMPGGTGVVLGTDAFVTKLTPDGQAFVFSTYFGGSGDEGAALAIDPARNIYIAGGTSSTNLPTATPLHSYRGRTDAFLASVTSDGSTLRYSTYLGGQDVDWASGIAVDNTGAAYVVGLTSSTDFPTVNAWRTAKAGSHDAFVARMNPAGTGLEYSTYVGGAGEDWPGRIAVDPDRRACVTGYTSSLNFPRTRALQTAHGGGVYDSFVTVLNSTGTLPAYSTYLGGSANDYGYSITCDARGAAYVCGETSSPNFPTRLPLQANLGGASDIFVTKIAPDGSSLTYSTYLGGSQWDQALGIAVHSDGSCYVTGLTNSTDFPVLNPAQANATGYVDAIVARLNAAGSALIYSTYLGRADWDSGVGIAAGNSGDSYVIGRTTSPNFPTVNPLTTTRRGGTDAFILRFGLQDTVAPTVAFTDPINNGWVRELTTLTGIARDNPGGAGVKRVNIRLRRVSDGLWWNGSAWTSSSTSYLAVTGTTWWHVTSPLPNGADLPEGAYTIVASVYDNAGNARGMTGSFKVEKQDPTVMRFTRPTNGETISSISPITGEAVDNPGGSGLATVHVRLRQINDPTTTADDRWWTPYAGWGTTQTLLKTNNLPSWQVTDPLPSGANLTPGLYRLYGYAKDKAANSTTAIITVTVQ